MPSLFLLIRVGASVDPFAITFCFFHPRIWKTLTKSRARRTLQVVKKKSLALRLLALALSHDKDGSETALMDFKMALMLLERL